MDSTVDLVTSSVNELVKDAPEKTFKEMTTSERISYIKSVITVEPLLIFYFIPTFICGPALSTLQLEKSCKVNANFNDTICDAILSGLHENYTAENENVQEIVAEMLAWQVPMQNIVPLILILFLASYSDRHKIRKPFLLIPIIGELFSIGGCILCVIFMRQLPVEFQGFSQTVIPSILGGSATLIMAIFAYISDISALEMRTLRIGIIQIILTVCSLLSALGGYLFTQIGYYGVLAIGGASYVIAIVYGIFCIKEETTKVKHNNAKDFFNDVFNPKHAVDTFGLLLKPRNRTNVAQLYLVIVIFFISCLVVFGEANIFWLFAQHVYGYTPVKFSYYDSIKNALIVIGSLIFLPLFTKVFILHDAVIIIITFIDKIISNLILIFLLNEVGLYAATTVANCASIGNTALRSMATKSVQVSDLAKALSLLSLCETFASMAAAPLYSGLIYAQTLATDPTVFLYVSIGLFVASVTIVFCLYVCYPKMFKYDIMEDPKKVRAQEKYHQTTKL